MIYHISGVSVYMDRFVSFTRQNNAQLKGHHCFVFCDGKKYKDFDANDCTYADGLWPLMKLFLFSKKDDRFILHSYMHPWLYLTCFIAFWNLKKVLWVIWGADLYFYTENKNLKYKLYEFFRKRTIKRFGYIMGVKGDFALAQKYYKVKGKHLSGVYPLEFFDIPADNVKRTTVNVLIGNSADPSNHHIECLKLLQCFYNQDVKIYIPLSYGGTPEYIQQVEQVGISLFGDKCIVVKKLMDICVYHEFLSTMDIFICNHNRQQALGNIFPLFKMGKKVFIRKGISTEDLLNDYGIKFFFTQAILDMQFEDFVNFNQSDKDINRKIVDGIYAKESLIKNWNNSFSRLLEERTS